MNALIVKKPWLDLILSGKKNWEIRGSNTKIRGKIELIQSGSGTIVGCCDIVGCKEINIEMYQNNVINHQITDTKKLPYKKTFVWIIQNAQRYKEPRQYQHPKGAIIWVKIR